MAMTVVIKLLGRNIGFLSLQDKISNLWRPSMSFHLMDIENGYFLFKFHSKEDYDKVLSQGPWIVFGQYLTVQSWSKDFDPARPYPRKAVRLDFNTDSRARGKFARMAVFINLDKPLVSQILINGVPQRIEYESLSIVCFAYGRYDHGKDLCSSTKTDTVKEGELIVATGNGNNAIVLETVGGETESANFGPWMLVEKKSRRNPRGNRGFGAEIKGNNFSEPRYIILNYAN
ncbi:hypothetical protein Goshw_020980 [Gossypium schwendimanii]|uniref:DUF4283 domain-containing protein n=1 Tax=Gossypium schwendimanii TaxID=34291 RepID=A0A7J9N130_GOSSC|nr:hypothetical protein [Gossypium schwendimanii]